jgi:hypothetical protein
VNAKRTEQWVEVHGFKQQQPFLLQQSLSVIIITTKQKKTPWPESVSELYRLSERRLSEK